ncbi:MAG: LysE family transporter [Steroidobacteraceae bacterium]
MDGAFWKTLAFGVILAGSIGPIALLIIATAARRGTAAGCFAGLGAALADFAYALLAFTTGALLLPLLDAHATAIRVACAALLIGLGLALLLRRADAAGAAPAPRPAAQALLPTFLLTLVNPLTLVVFTGFVPQLPVAGSLPTAAWLAFALFLGSLSVQTALAIAGSLLGAALPGARWQRLISRASALGVLAFGLAGLYAAA